MDETPIASANGAEDPESYYELAEPIQVGNRTIEKLLIDSRKLSGLKYFPINETFRRMYPDVWRTTSNKNKEEEYISLVIAELNQIAPEDLRKLQFTEQTLLFMRAQSFLYSGGTKKT